MTKENTRTLQHVVDDLKSKGFKHYGLLYIPSDKRECDPIETYEVIPLSDGKYDAIIESEIFKSEGSYDCARIYSTDDVPAKPLARILVTQTDDI